MIKLEMENYNMILTDKQQKYCYYHYQMELMNMNVLQGKTCYLQVQVKGEVGF